MGRSTDTRRKRLTVMTEIVERPPAILELLRREQLLRKQHHLPQVGGFWLGDPVLLVWLVLEQRGAGDELEHL